MKFKDIKFLVFLIFGAFLIGCSSGEYDLEKIQIKYTEKTLKYDTIKVLVQDTVVKKEEYKEKTREKFTFIVQVGAFKESGNFQRFFDACKLKLGDEIYYAFVNELYKIRIGSYKNKADALQMLENVKSKGYIDAFIVTIITK